MFVTLLLAAGLLAVEREENVFSRLVRGLISKTSLVVEKIGGASDAPWVIIDDNRAQYPEGVKVIPTEPQKGFDERAAAALSMELRVPGTLTTAGLGAQA
jgi:hypothetical protein